jgi:hypothetical protein
MDYVEEDLKEFVFGIPCVESGCAKAGAFYIVVRGFDEEKQERRLIRTVICEEHIISFLQDELIPILEKNNGHQGIINKPIKEAKE